MEIIESETFHFSFLNILSFLCNSLAFCTRESVKTDSSTYWLIQAPLHCNWCSVKTMLTLTSTVKWSEGRVHQATGEGITSSIMYMSTNLLPTAVQTHIFISFLYSNSGSFRKWNWRIMWNRIRDMYVDIIIPIGISSTLKSHFDLHYIHRDGCHLVKSFCQ